MIQLAIESNDVSDEYFKVLKKQGLIAYQQCLNFESLAKHQS